MASSGSLIAALNQILSTSVASNDYMILEDASSIETKRILISELLKLTLPAPTSFTPDFAAGTATFANQAGHYWQIFNFMYFQAYADVTGAGSTDLTMSVPNSLTIDTSYVLETSGVTLNDHFLSAGKWLDGGIYRHCHPVYFSNTVLKFSYEGGGALVGAVLANTDRLNLNGLIPISEWKAT